MMPKLPKTVPKGGPASAQCDLIKINIIFLINNIKLTNNIIFQ